MFFLVECVIGGKTSLRTGKSSFKRDCDRTNDGHEELLSKVSIKETMSCGWESMASTQCMYREMNLQGPAYIVGKMFFVTDPNCSIFPVS